MSKFCYQQRSRVTGDMYQGAIEIESLKLAARQIGHIFPESRKGGSGTEASPAIYASREYATKIWAVDDQTFSVLHREFYGRKARLYWESHPWTPVQIED